MTLSANTVLALLYAFDPGDHPDDLASLEQTIALLRRGGDPFDRRRYGPGHITASAVVLSPALEDVVLVNHRRVGGWVQPGGHVEPADADLPNAARREVLEETGLELSPRTDPPVVPLVPLVRVDVHEIPPAQGEPHHRHHDITFAFCVSSSSPTTSGDSEWTWSPVDELERFTVDASLGRSIERAVRCFRHHA